MPKDPLSILIDISIVNSNVHFPEHREAFIFFDFQGWRTCQGILKPVIFQLWASKLLKLQQEVYDDV